MEDKDEAALNLIGELTTDYMLKELVKGALKDADVGRREYLAGVDAAFGQRVREERERNHISQDALAGLMSSQYGQPWHQTTVAKVESGDRPAKITEVIALSWALGVSVEALIDPQGDARNPPVQQALFELDTIAQHIVRRRAELLERIGVHAHEQPR